MNSLWSGSFLNSCTTRNFIQSVFALELNMKGCNPQRGPDFSCSQNRSLSLEQSEWPVTTFALLRPMSLCILSCVIKSVIRRVNTTCWIMSKLIFLFLVRELVCPCQDVLTLLVKVSGSLGYLTRAPEVSYNSIYRL